jgi:hypothetical protein
MLTLKVSVTLRDLKGRVIIIQLEDSQVAIHVGTCCQLGCGFLSVSRDNRRHSEAYIWAEGKEDATYWLAGRLIRRGTGQGTDSVMPPYKWTSDDGGPRYHVKRHSSYKARLRRVHSDQNNHLIYNLYKVEINLGNMAFCLSERILRTMKNAWHFESKFAWPALRIALSRLYVTRQQTEVLGTRLWTASTLVF